ncbi:hypothetical protein CLHUN_42830 [Ruminiclostridium hungatei]|uniref:Immunity MXAN-0049 protein domain-containing protein n=1 Tax=Ruminiclostridium hungatei TaxID=48256 RepID=A0A1V4SEB5_RUMHU|nr:DUF1629 domain-containing protein [Ruminiclostridium hungatei]OPX41846.1 hypothetical protein CLHUN_42830 [Ruminiclostridium hungatei]
MKIWILQEDVNNYEHLTLANGGNEDWIEFGDMFKTRKLEDSWEPLKLKLINHDGKLKRGDMPYLSPGKPVFTKKAIESLRGFLEGNAEVLPIDYELQELFILNIINRIDAIDYEKSEIKYGDEKRIIRVKKYSFVVEKIKNQHIFKILNQLFGTVFVSDEFRNKVIESGLEGFKFVEVWDSEE